jgi:hypothetical protein
MNGIGCSFKWALDGKYRFEISRVERNVSRSWIVICPITSLLSYSTSAWKSGPNFLHNDVKD